MQCILLTSGPLLRLNGVSFPTSLPSLLATGGACRTRLHKRALAHRRHFQTTQNISIFGHLVTTFPLSLSCSTIHFPAFRDCSSWSPQYYRLFVNNSDCLYCNITIYSMKICRNNRKQKMCSHFYTHSCLLLCFALLSHHASVTGHCQI